MTPTQAVIARVAFFEKLYDAFYGYFVEKLSKDDSKYAKYSIQMQSRFVDDLDLQKVVLPVYAEFSSNVEEKRAVAQAALYDALVAHTFSKFLGDASQAVHVRMDVLEKATGTVITQQQEKLVELERRIDYLMENQNAVSKRKQVRVGTETRVEE